MLPSFALCEYIAPIYPGSVTEANTPPHSIIRPRREQVQLLPGHCTTGLSGRLLFPGKGGSGAPGRVPAVPALQSGQLPPAWGGGSVYPGQLPGYAAPCKSQPGVQPHGGHSGGSSTKLARCRGMKMGSSSEDALKPKAAQRFAELGLEVQ